MPRVVPSQVVGLIDKLFPRAKDEEETTPGCEYSLSPRNSHSVAALLELIQQLPSELITLEPEAYAEFVSATATLRTLIAEWQAGAEYNFYYIQALRHLSPVTLIRQALAKCPDEFPSTSISELTFIEDEDRRETLGRDIGAVNSAFSNLEWKAATVLAGSVIEALLLWALEKNKPGDVDASVERLFDERRFDGNRPIARRLPMRPSLRLQSAQGLQPARGV
jgi:hypothetical protein